MAIVVHQDTVAPPFRQGRRRSAADCWDEASVALFRRLDPACTGYIHEDQVQWLWPTLTQHVEGASRDLASQRQHGGAQVSLVEWQSLTAAIAAVVGHRRFKSSIRRADVIVSKGQLPSNVYAPLASSVTIPSYAPIYQKPAHFGDSKSNAGSARSVASPAHAPAEADARPASPAPAEALTVASPAHASVEADARPASPAPAEALTVASPAHASVEAESRPDSPAPAEAESRPDSPAPAEAEARPDSPAHAEAEASPHSPELAADGAQTQTEEAGDELNDQNAGVLATSSQQIEAKPSAALMNLPPEEAAEADAFLRRFRELKEMDPLLSQKNKPNRSPKFHLGAAESVTEEGEEAAARHEVMGVNTRLLHEAREKTMTPENQAQQRTGHRPSWPQSSAELSWEEEQVVPSESRTQPEIEKAPSGKSQSEELAGPPRGPTGSTGSTGSCQLPKIDAKLSRAASAPGSICEEESMESILESCAVKALRDRLRSEMTLHEQTRTRAKELERRLLQATKREGREGREGKSRFGVTSPTPYAAKPEKPREKRSVVLPPLISPKPQPRAPQRPQGGPLAGVQDMLKDERMMSLSREEQSRTRVQAFRELGRVGLSTWDVRMGEKVSRFQDMRAFSDSMWNSFYDWNSQYQSVG